MISITRSVLETCQWIILPPRRSKHSPHGYALSWLVVPRTNSCFERIRSIMANENPSHFWLVVLIFVYEGTWLSECNRTWKISRMSYPLVFAFYFLRYSRCRDRRRLSCWEYRSRLMLSLYLSLSSRFKQPKKPVRPRSISTMHRFCYVHDSSFPLKFKFSAFLIAWAFIRFRKSNDHMLQVSDRLKMRSTSYTSHFWKQHENLQ